MLEMKMKLYFLARAEFVFLHWQMKMLDAVEINISSNN